MDTKAIGVIDLTVKALKSEDPNGEFEAILSAPTLDRDNEIVDARAFEPLPERITIDTDHGMSVDTTVGSGVPFYDGDILKVRGSFSSIPRAQEVRTLVTEGHITKMSVAFLGRTAIREIDKKDGKQHVRRAELLNAAIVPIPSNREADMLAAKAHIEKVGARNSLSDLEKIQAAHDALADLGAGCKQPAITLSSDAADSAGTPWSVTPDVGAKTATDPEPAAASAAAAPASVTEARFLSELAAAEVALL